MINNLISNCIHGTSICYLYLPFRCSFPLRMAPHPALGAASPPPPLVSPVPPVPPPSIPPASPLPPPPLSWVTPSTHCSVETVDRLAKTRSPPHIENNEQPETNGDECKARSLEAVSAGWLPLCWPSTTFT